MYLNGLRAVAVIAGLLAVLAASPGRSLGQTSPQSWPQRPVKFIVPFGPGAGADIGARLLAERLPARWGKPLVIENPLSMLKTAMYRERLEIFAPPPYRGGHDHDDFRFRFAALVPLS